MNLGVHRVDGEGSAQKGCPPIEESANIVRRAPRQKRFHIIRPTEASRQLSLSEASLASSFEVVDEDETPASSHEPRVPLERSFVARFRLVQIGRAACRGREEI